MNKLFIGIQSRLNSSRFPKKALCPILGIPLIIRVIQRVSQIKYPHQTALLVPYNEKEIFQQCLNNYQINIPVFGGNENNVLSRFYEASLQFQATDLIMRVTGDNPLISIPLANLLIQHHNEKKCDLSHYLNNPLGTGVELITFVALEKAVQKATSSEDLEHVTKYIYNHPDIFYIEEPASPYIKEEYTHLSVDYPQDIELIERLLLTNPNWDISL